MELGYARRAEEAGFPCALISGHFHPWIDRRVGPDQEGFFDFYDREVLPEIDSLQPSGARRAVRA